MRSRAAAALLALLLAAVALVAVELGLGGAGYGSVRLADPCHPRQFRGDGIDGAVQGVVLDGLSGAACRLGTSREQLVLSLGSSGTTHLPPKTESALRAGLLAAVDRAERTGQIPGFLAPLVSEAIRSVPLDQLIRGAFALGG